MIYQFKGNENAAHAYLLCRFGKCVLIDPNQNYEEIIQKIGDQTLEYILLTHAHSDHVMLIGMFHVPIYIHELDASLLFEDNYNGFLESKRPYKRKDLNILSFSDSKIAFADSYIEIIHTPGHTKGSVCFKYHDILFTGDTLFKHSVGRSDLYGGKLQDLKRSVLRLLDEYPANTKIYPGHDEYSSVRAEKKENPFYVKWSKQAKI